MSKKYLYFQPQYVREFVCDASKCDDNCCARNWNIEIDAQTYERYKSIRSESLARQITACFRYNDAKKSYFLNEQPCPFLTDKNLCGLQLEFGEQFISQTCVTYPRRTWNFGTFFERTLSLSCPVAAEMILFNDAPMKFELLPVTDEFHTRDGKIFISDLATTAKYPEQRLETQVAMISILQERTLTLDQRLIVLGFFLDRLDEITSDGFDVDALTKLIAVYESKSFLSEQVPRMLATVNFDEKKFVTLTIKIIEAIYGHWLFDAAGKKFLDALNDTLDILPDADKKIPVDKIAADYVRLADERQIFLIRYATFLENFLVNETLTTCLPWLHEGGVAKNFGVFVATYKLFELLMFAATRKNLCGKGELLQLVAWFTNQADHNQHFAKRILPCVPDDIFSTLETFLTGA